MNKKLIDKELQTKTRPNVYDDDCIDDAQVQKEAEKENLKINRISDNNKKTDTKSVFKNFLAKVLIVVMGLILSIILFAWLVSLFLPAKTTFLLMATDYDGTRTDSMIYGVFDRVDKTISIISIPRDTYVTVDEETFELMRQDFPEPPSKSMKINTVHHYGGEKHGVQMAISEVEKLTGTEIGFYAKINFDAFRYIIDELGGIDFYVPRNMEYHDPLQNLDISLKEGQQKLDGKQAEQLLRYRSGYANADLGRIGVQQEFVKAFISQVFSKNTLVLKPLSFIKLVTDENLVDTNANFLDVLSYLFKIKGFEAENISSQTLPGYSANRAGQSVYIYNEKETADIISELMKK